jgi:hypothetical protein
MLTRAAESHGSARRAQPLLICSGQKPRFLHATGQSDAEIAKTAEGLF